MECCTSTMFGLPSQGQLPILRENNLTKNVKHFAYEINKI